VEVVGFADAGDVSRGYLESVKVLTRRIFDSWRLFCLTSRRLSLRLLMAKFWEQTVVFHGTPDPQV
jgi:hypothetical protein